MLQSPDISKPAQNFLNLYKLVQGKKPESAKVTYFWGKSRNWEFYQKYKSKKKGVKSIESCYFLRF